MKQFVIKREDGGVSIGHVIGENNIDDVVSKWNETAKSKSIYHQYEERLPNDIGEYFFDAYDHSPEQGVFIDLDKAKIVHLNQLRKIRSQKFIDMGFPQRINPEIENAILSQEIRDKLKSLRDFPQNLDLSQINDPKILRNVIPDILK